MVVLLALACSRPSPALFDGDGDGIPAAYDCDDADADVFPGANEVCDGVDNDCDGEVDEAPIDLRTWYLDADGDGFGSTEIQVCDGPPGAVRRGGDCDDGDPDTHPGAPETCDGEDDDCDGDVDEEPARIWVADADGDGAGDPGVSIAACDPGPGWVDLNAPHDCDDTSAARHPDADELCDGLDDDCDGLVDDADPDVLGELWYADTDGDGHGVADVTILACAPSFGTWATVVDDCDDFEADVHPGALETCDGRDEDCDGTIDRLDAPLDRGITVAIEVTPTGVVEQGIAIQLVDLAAVHADAGGTGTFDPAGVRVAFGDCDVGFEEVPARFLDGWDALGVPGTDGDGHGLLVVSWDTDGDAGTREVLAAPRTGTLVFGSHATVGGLAAAADGIDAPWGRLELAPDGAGRLEIDGTLVFDQALFAPSVQLPSATLGLPASPTVTVDAHPALSIVGFEGTSAAAGGAVDLTSTWWVVGGRREAWVHTSLVTSGVTSVFGEPAWPAGVRAFAAGVVGSPVTDGPWARYPFAHVGLYAGPAGAVAEPGLIRVPGVLDPTTGTVRSFGAGETIATVTAVIAREDPGSAFVIAGDGLSPSLAITFPGSP
ncbi:MAG: putative metal-binding motif-containing protein [Alphaproteobacteria bacterium]|nr:putative metal-binding motif-containing protein [Alphaproteobacteria bacterium]